MGSSVPNHSACVLRSESCLEGFLSIEDGCSLFMTVAFLWDPGDFEITGNDPRHIVTKTNPLTSHTYAILVYSSFGPFRELA